jgi:hypothetical protein
MDQRPTFSRPVKPRSNRFFAALFLLLSLVDLKKSSQNNIITMSLPVDQTLIDTFPKTMAWRFEPDGGHPRRVTAKGGADLRVYFIKSEAKLRLYMKGGDRSWDLAVLNTNVPLNNVITRKKPNCYVFKEWSATEQGREAGRRDIITIQLDSFESSFRFVSYFLMAAKQTEKQIGALFPPPTVRAPLRIQQLSQQQQRRDHQEDEEEEVAEDVDDDKSVDLLGDDDTGDDDEDTLGTLTDKNIRHEKADDDDDDDDDNNGHLGFADCSQQHVFIGMSNLRL